ncbi:hypothetical protein CTA1_11496 [Colletotrichum tanaceti]|uniref:Uncharacterized protein n=1 Tax=Colletotrichum tanaceti TaxID=1306861 RepID=A0A4U6XU80_9PEZI|nr:hypothetical protein CTA1_11496 [Colletotrichum tanaceti]
MIYSLMPALASLTEPVASTLSCLNDVILGVERVGNMSESLARDPRCYPLSVHRLPAWKRFLGLYGDNQMEEREADECWRWTLWADEREQNQ